MNDIDTNTRSFINLASKSTDPSNDLLKTNNGGVSVDPGLYGNATPEYIDAHKEQNSMSGDEYNSRVNSGSINTNIPDSIKNPSTIYRESMETEMMRNKDFITDQWQQICQRKEALNG